MQLDFENLKLYLPYDGDSRFFEAIVRQAQHISDRNTHFISLDVIADTLIKEELEKAEQAKLNESLIDFNDEIVEIEVLDNQEMVDITVSRDNLFYANGILTKNSMGIPATADLMLSLSRTEELDGLGQVLWKQLKNRYGNKVNNLRFVTGVDLEKQTIYDVNQQEQKDLVVVPPQSGPSDTSRFKDKFANFKMEM